MINYNGDIITQSGLQVEQNRGFLYGDSIFDTVKTLNGRVLFSEDHYFRLMASLRIARMDIAMDFTLDYMESEIIKLTETLEGAPSYRARISFYRRPGGRYLPSSRETEFIITAEPLTAALYSINTTPYEVELYKDFFVAKQLLSTLKTNNRIVNTLASIFAAENGYNNCLLINDEKNVIEAIQGNIFMLSGTLLITPPISDGCLNGVMRKQILEIAKKIEGIEVIEKSISPFELQKADELFLTNVIAGIQPITKYRKKEYTNLFSLELVKRLNAKVRLG
ncbi:aminotransferase class IV [Flavobacterium sp. RHBU_24]|uniref:aminotransferase class IV n=1 Tax=Flavobacterium sp. RHBU_24 TaxID=3391185 RepID=UPI003984DF1E